MMKIFQLNILILLFAGSFSYSVFGQNIDLIDLGWTYGDRNIRGEIGLTNNTDSILAIAGINSVSNTILAHPHGLCRLKPGESMFISYDSNLLHKRFREGHADILCNYENHPKRDDFYIPLYISFYKNDTIDRKVGLRFYPTPNKLSHVITDVHEFPCSPNNELSKLIRGFRKGTNSIYLNWDLYSFSETIINDTINAITGYFVINNPSSGTYLLKNLKELTTGAKINIEGYLVERAPNEVKRLYPENCIVFKFYWRNPTEELIKEYKTKGLELNFQVELQGSDTSKTFHFPFILKSDLALDVTPWNKLKN